MGINRDDSIPVASRKGPSDSRQRPRSLVYLALSSMRKAREGGRIGYKSRRTRDTIRVSLFRVSGFDHLKACCLPYLMCSTGAIMCEGDFEFDGDMYCGWRSESLTTVGSSWSISSSLKVRGRPRAAERYLSSEYATQNVRRRLSSST